MGDLDGLARSIEEVGLLQPIGITPDCRLVFGQRRLLVYQDILGQESIPARIVPVESMRSGEIAENTMRKDYTPSELVAIVQAIRTFSHGGDRRSDQARSCDVEGMTTEEAARKVGCPSPHASRLPSASPR
jgi:ParB-like chromosome segregation protein Spo0J